MIVPDQHVLPPLASRGRIALTEPELADWGERLGSAARPGLVVAIAGELGAGKTTLVRAICKGYGVHEPVTSPTYALVHEYEGGQSTVYHLDLYRLTDAGDLTNIGWDEIITSGGLVLVEWPDRAGSRLPPEHLPIALEYAPGDPDHRILLAG